MDDYSKLTDEQLVEMARSRNEAAMNEIINRYRPLVETIARRYYIKGGDNDDTKQEGLIGLFGAIQSFEPGFGKEFSHFASSCIKNRILNAVQKADNKTNSMFNEAMEKGESEIPDGIQFENPETKFIYEETLRFIMEMLSGKTEGPFSKLELEVVELKTQGKDYKEIAAILGKSPKSIDNAIQRAKAKTKKLMNQ